jgi:isoamylase
MDSLRYWADEMHVDGFRFDLAATLGRTRGPFDPLGAFFGAVVQDPALVGTKLIAEPWDVGPGGYQVGSFPPRWMEWNDRYRDGVRDFWKSTDGSLAVFATRITGSSDLYEARGRRPTATVNYATSHDGFTLTDLVSYDWRHNEANGEDNRDGHPDNRSWNSGAEGPTTDPEVRAIRERRRRSLLATVLLSQGVPMILGGDEIGRTQDGNNNAYNQDNPISWYDWGSADGEILDFTRQAIAIRAAHPTFRRSAWLHEYGDDQHDHVGWFTPDGRPMTVSDWHRPDARAVALYLAGAVVHAAGATTADDDFLLLFNGGGDEVTFRIVDPPNGWEMELDTTGVSRISGNSVPVAGFGLVVLRRPDGRAGQPSASKR